VPCSEALLKDKLLIRYFISLPSEALLSWTATGEMKDEEEREVVKRSPRDCSAPLRSLDRKPRRLFYV
jgi:hypothetical protein